MKIIKSVDRETISQRFSEVRQKLNEVEEKLTESSDNYKLRQSVFNADNMDSD